jgi:hypothetical protein
MFQNMIANENSVMHAMHAGLLTLDLANSEEHYEPTSPPYNPGVQFDSDDSDELRDYVSVTTRTTRSTIQSGELDFSDDGPLASTEEEQNAELPPAITLEDLYDDRRSRLAHSITSSADVMNLRTAERTDRQEALSQTYESMTSGYLGHAGWIGIPPLHHQTELSIPYTEDDIPDYGYHSAVATPSPIVGRRSHYSLILGSQIRKAKMALREMPTHLLPFVPYIEKRIDETKPSEPAREAWGMNVDIIRAWLDQCNTCHGSACYSNESLQPRLEHGSRPLYLIDVQDGCIVPTPEHSRYVALSYVWGNGEASTCTTIANLQELQMPEGLYRRDTSLPRVILDAVHLVETLGERYLWIDRLCIVQDDYATKHHQLSSMGEIYAGAFFTLVAAQNDEAALGLYGPRRMSIGPVLSSAKERARRLPISRLSSKQILLTHAMSLMQTKWYSRGWTFQEYIFSRRRVIFHNHTVNWECLCSSWHESQNMSRVASYDKPIEESNSRGLATRAYTPSTGLKLTPWPDMLRYTRLTSLFNERDLTFPEDVLDAYAGCLHHLSRVFPEGFISGLPAMCFDAALLWQPWTRMKRRQTRRLSPDEAVLPSWSWAGWEGVINSESLRSASNYQFEDPTEMNCRRESTWKTLSTVKWVYMESLTSERQAIVLPPQFARPSFAKVGDSMPPGWAISAENRGGVVYRSCDPTAPFRFPIPVVGVEAPCQPVVSARYLHCKTRRAFLILGKEFKSKASNCPAVQLTAPSGRWAGILRLNCFPYECKDLLEEHYREEEGRCELIEISAGSVEDRSVDAPSFDEWDEPECGRSDGLYEFINVLWIEWVEGIAYRKALGRVKKCIWEEEAKGSVDVILG